MSKIKTKLLTMLLGFIFLFLVIEFTVRASHFVSIYSRKNGFENSQLQIDQKKIFTILMIGNSHTYGAGVKAHQAYPVVLQRFFDQQSINSEYKFRVINVGEFNVNTSDIYNRIDKWLSTYNPNLAVLMIGQPNTWNKNGYDSYLEHKKNEKQYLQRSLNAISEYSKAVKWMLMLSDLSKTVVLTEEQKNLLAVYQEIARIERQFDELENKPNVNALKKEVLDWYLEKFKNTDSKIYRTVLYARAVLELAAYRNELVALNFIEKSILKDQKEFDFLSYLFLTKTVKRYVISYQSQIKADQLLELLNQAKSSLDGVDTKDISSLVLNSSIQPMAEADRLRLLQVTNRLMPFLSIPAAMLYRKYQFMEKQPELAQKYLLSTLEVNPFSNRTASMQTIVSQAKDLNIKIKKNAEDYIKKISDEFPTEIHLLDLDQSERLEDWLSWDMDRIVKKLKQSGVVPVLQNYHILRGNIKDQETIHRSALKTAELNDIHFIDTHSEFMQAVNKNPKDQETFFVQSYGPSDSHPSPKGHKYIAYIIYKNLINFKILPEEISHFDPNNILLLPEE